MGRKANKQNKSKQRKFREAKKNQQRMRLQELTRIPKKQVARWAPTFTPLAKDLVETEHDPDFVAFCITKQLDAWDDMDFLWLRIATALREGEYTFKTIDRLNVLRPFDKETFTKSIAENDFEHEVGLRYEADKFLCYLAYGTHPRFRASFGYVLLPSIKNHLAGDVTIIDYMEWFCKEPTVELTKKLLEFDAAAVE